MKIHIGLDISTSTVGVCAIYEDIKKPLYMGYISLSKYRDIWEKAEVVEEKLKEIRDNLLLQYPDAKFGVAYEEPMQRLSGGNSSSGVIVKLAWFNGFVACLSSNIFGFRKPIPLESRDARRLSGLKISKKIKIKEKVQAFNYVVSKIGDEWVEYKRTGSVKDQCLDASDAWIIATAYITMTKSPRLNHERYEASENEKAQELYK
jgi:hypothetical protein